MPESKAMPGFGEVDLDIEDDPSAAVPAAPASTIRVDPALGGDADAVPPSTSRVVSGGLRSAIGRGSVHDESTRIVAADALAAITRPPPRAVHDDGVTRAWADIDALAAGDDPPSSRSGSSAASASGVGARDDRVAAMRELYARGDAAGALALASTLGHGIALPSHGDSADSPDASIFVEYGEASIAIDDPFGGLIPMDVELEEEAAPLSKASATPTNPPPGAQLTLTERQSIPRRLTALADLSKLKIDHRAGFLLAHVDGMQTLEEILDVCAMPAAEALSLFANLKALGVIEFE
jgi:hypothetical protein